MHNKSNVLVNDCYLLTLLYSMIIHQKLHETKQHLCEQEL